MNVSSRYCGRDYKDSALISNVSYYYLLFFTKSYVFIVLLKQLINITFLYVTYVTISSGVHVISLSVFCFLLW